MFRDLFGWIGTLGSWLKTFFQDAYEFLRKHIIRHLVAILTAAYEILSNIVGVFVKIIQTIHDWYYKHVYKIQKKILNVISITRVFLSLLRLLGVKWAAKLDAILKQVATYVSESIFYVVNTLNTLSSYMALVVDPGMILSRPFLAASILSNLDLVKRAGAYGSNNALSATDQQSEADSNTLLYGSGPLVTIDENGQVQRVPAMQNIADEGDAAEADYKARVQ